MTVNGYLQSAVASTTLADRYRTLEAYWTVPDAPIGSYGSPGKVYYTFPGLVSVIHPYTIIYQPVLQYGNSSFYGGAYWTLASWICGPVTCWYSTVLTALPGDVIHGVAGFYACDAVCITTVAATNTRTNLSSYMYGSAYGDPDYASYAYVSVEAYSINACNDFPATGVFFSDISITKMSGPTTPSWAAEYMPSPTPSCNYNVTFTNNSVTLFHN